MAIINYYVVTHDFYYCTNNYSCVNLSSTFRDACSMCAVRSDFLFFLLISFSQINMRTNKFIKRIEVNSINDVRWNPSLQNGIWSKGDTKHIYCKQIAIGGAGVGAGNSVNQIGSNCKFRFIHFFIQIFYSLALIVFFGHS